MKRDEVKQIQLKENRLINSNGSTNKNEMCFPKMFALLLNISSRPLCMDVFGRSLSLLTIYLLNSETEFTPISSLLFDSLVSGGVSNGPVVNF